MWTVPLLVLETGTGVDGMVMDPTGGETVPLPWVKVKALLPPPGMLVV